MRDNFNRSMTALWRAAKAGFDFGDMIFLVAVGAVGYGIAQIYQPAAWIVVGGIFIMVVRKPSGGDR